MKSQKVLVVDDEPKVVKLLTINLRANDFEVAIAGTGEQAVSLAAEEGPDLIVLDLMLPDLDGFEVCRRIREFSDVPIIMLTARAREADKLAGFRMGIDDYITKPFSVKELLARVQAVLRRAKGESHGPAIVELGRVRVDLGTRRAYVDGKLVPLTPTEFKLLSHLIGSRGKVLLHSNLLATVWGPEYVESIDYLRVYVSHLRRKLGDNPDDPLVIRTVPGVGYYISEENA